MALDVRDAGWHLSGEGKRRSKALSDKHNTIKPWYHNTTICGFVLSFYF